MEIAWGHRVRGEPTGYNDVDSDEETDLSLLASEQREQARELKQRRKCMSDLGESRFVLLKEGETWFGEDNVEWDLTCAYGILGPDV